MATDSGGLNNTSSILLYPKTVKLTFNSNPAGLQLTVNSSSGATSFNRTVIINSSNSASALSPQALGGATYEFTSWSDGGAASRTIVAGATDSAYTANYADTIPATPTNLTANAVTGLQINLAWSDNSSNENGFKIERCAGSGCTNFAEVKSVAANVNTYQDSALNPKTTYRYRVRAYHNTYTSPYSNTVSAKTRPR